jgi:predicted ATPase
VDALLERGEELAALESIVEAARDGRGQLVLVAGEAGIGKTSLVRALRERLGERAAFLIGVCEPPGAPGPFRLSEPGALRRLVEEASFEVSIVGDAAAAFVYPDEPTALRGLLSAGPSVKAIAHSGEGAVRDATLESIAPYRREDGSYAFDNVWRFAIARRA